MSDFRQDAIDLFERKRGGHVQHWLYSSRQGSTLWDEFYKSSRGYYIPHDEMKLIQDKGASLIEKSCVDTVVDFGPGSKGAVIKKTMPIIEGLQSVKIYTGVDISADFLSQARAAVNESRPDLQVQTHQKDFHVDQLVLGGSKRLGLLFGCSVTNQEMLEGRGLPHDEIVKNLQDFRRHLGEGGELLVTYDDNPDAQHAMAAYQSPYWSAHVVGFMRSVADQLQTGGDFSADDWHHDMVWDPNVHVIHQCIVADRAQTLVMGDKEFHFRKGERFVAVNNFKFPKAEFEALCQDAGFKLGQFVEENTIRLQHLSV